MQHQPSGAHRAVGDLLRRYREVAGLSQESLAERAGISPRGLLYLERGMRRPYPATLLRLADALSLTPQEREALALAIRQGGPPVPPATEDTPEPPADRPTAGQAETPATGPMHNLPASLSSFIGREQALARVHELLAAHRLVSLVGAGGVGKTRLAVAVAEGILGVYPDGVWLVELAPLADPALVPGAVAQVLGLREEPSRSILETLRDQCGGRCLVLVLDNCEHLLAACTALAGTLLRAAPALRILATSREALGIAGERHYRVPPLSVPDPGHLPSPELAGSYEAVRLFVARAQERRDTFALTAANARAVAEICARLDGIPLAIELAAARVASVSVETIAARLDDRFRLLSTGSGDLPTRQRTLRATLDWSWDLLDARERTLLGQSSVFAGGWTLEAAGAVCGAEGLEPWEVLDLLGGLVNKSLIQVDGPGAEAEAARYGLLETMRQYATERLAERGERAGVRDRHLGYFLNLAEEAVPHLNGGEEQKVWLDRLEAEHDNLRAALAWALDQGAGDAGLRLGGALWRFWLLRAYLGEGRRWLERLLGVVTERPTHGRATALLGVGWLACRQGARDRAATYLAQSLTLFRALGDRYGEAAALTMAGAVAWERGEYDDARIQGDAALAFARQLGDPAAIALALHHRGDAAYKLGDLQDAQDLYSESLAIRRTLGDRAGMSEMLNNLGGLLADTGSHEEAAAMLAESLALARQVGDLDTAAYAEMNLGQAYGRLGEYDRARHLLDGALGSFRGMGDRVHTAEVLRRLGSLALLEGSYPEADSRLLQTLALSLELGDRPSVGLCLLWRALLAWRLTDLAQAQALYAESLTLFRAMHDRYLMAWAVHGLGLVTAGYGRWSLAARLFGAVEGALAPLGAVLEPELRDEGHRQGAAIRAALGEETFAADWAKGRAMTLDEAIALALKSEPTG